MTDRQLPPSSPGRPGGQPPFGGTSSSADPTAPSGTFPPHRPPDDQAANRRCRPGSSARPRFPGRMAAPTRIRLRGSPPRRRRRRPLPLPSPWAAAWSSRRRCSAWSRSARTSSHARPTASRSCARKRPLPAAGGGGAAAPIGPPSIPDVGQGGDADAKGSDAAATDETGAKGLPHGWDPSAGYAVAEETFSQQFDEDMSAYGLRVHMDFDVAYPRFEGDFDHLGRRQREPSATQP